ncbi:MAG: M20/M25/M40 family metallo-hydrolase [Fuerstiella sp.]|nr:M20/M25/M40 family metallo-hydrolase [Fuerstiella sp.]
MNRNILTAVSLISVFGVMSSAPADSHRGAAVERVRADIEFFASDEQEGRGVATAGIDRAAGYIVDEFRNMGLTSVMPDRGWHQKFDVRIGATGVSNRTALSFQSSRGTRLRLVTGKDWQPLERGSSGSASGGLVFVGYGISSPHDNYDEYADVDVAGKIIVLIRRVPGQGDPESVFSGDSTSTHAYITTKLRLARERNAAAVLLVNDPFTAPDPESDKLADSDGFGQRGGPVPFMQIRQDVLDRLLKESPLRTSGGELLTSVRSAARYLDRTMLPVSQELRSWSVNLNVEFQGRTVEGSNLIGMVEGQGPNSHETIIVGGHYDHIGFGDYGSRARNRRGEIHNGADDNASGTAAVLELARRVAAGPAPNRRIVFICFSGEERGLLGSRHYISRPLFPLDDTVFMFNFDMIGSLRNNHMEVNGVGTGAEFLPLVQQADESTPVSVKIVSSPFGGSDHLPFYRKQIPVLFCFTGVTDRYHTPDDDVEMINMDGVVSVIELGERLLHAVDGLPVRPSYRRCRRGRTRMAVLGVRPDLSDSTGRGVGVLSVRDGSPAADASVQTGDIIVNIGEQQIDGYPGLYDFLRKAPDGRYVPLIVERNGQRVGLRVKLGTASR